VFRSHGEVALADVLTIRAHGTPKWSSEIRQSRRSCGEKVGTPAAVQARAIAVRERSPPKPGRPAAPEYGRRAVRAAAHLPEFPLLARSALCVYRNRQDPYASAPSLKGRLRNSPPDSGLVAG
jgi:hypothetical protein